MQISSTLRAQVNLFLESGDRAFLASLKELDRDNIEGKATIRYLMQKKHWPFTPDSDFSDLLTHFFAAFPERKPIEPADYQATTFQLIKDTWDYECVVVIPEVKEKPVEAEKPKAKKATRASKDEFGSNLVDRKGAIVDDVDTTGASSRLKEVIAIQRGS